MVTSIFVYLAEPGSHVSPVIIAIKSSWLTVKGKKKKKHAVTKKQDISKTTYRYNNFPMYIQYSQNFSLDKKISPNTATLALQKYLTELIFAHVVKIATNSMQSLTQDKKKNICPWEQGAGVKMANIFQGKNF